VDWGKIINTTMRNSSPAHDQPTDWSHLLGSTSDPALIDAGAVGELVVARVRVGLMVALCTVPVAGLLLNPKRKEYLIALLATAVGLVVAVVVLRVLLAGKRPSRLALFTSLFDVTLISATQMAYLLQGMPSVAANSRTTFLAYFIALGATCMRWDLRLCLVTGGMALVQYATIAIAAGMKWPSVPTPDVVAFGGFDAAQQFGRLIFLGSFVVICAAIIRQSIRLRITSTHDALTGLNNRAFFEERMQEELQRARRSGRALALALVDVDRFKSVNDEYGHEAGDVALRQVANVLRQSVRQSDLVARWGGEEFAIAFPETTPDDAFRKVDLLRAAVAAHSLAFPNGASVRLTVSAGVSAAPFDGDALRDLFLAADECLLEAKETGRDRVVMRRDPQLVMRPLGVLQMQRDGVEGAARSVVAR
jgi:diguanylate cyclase (GGDEF)-like protein